MRIERRILVVDDHRDVRYVCGVLFRAAGHEVEVAESTDLALSIARWFRPDIVLCDLRLQGEWDGCDMARAIRLDTDLRDIYMCAITGSADREEHGQALQAGFDEVLLKPLDYGVLIDNFARTQRAGWSRNTDLANDP